ncbi:uncharacterized protein LOC143355451 [Halictus rubicundus]|uniref:uncharacterized protein LOC143355451 n=1 Tax=Halictus rubicundus TaxID=77578 RepID=UPI0040354EB3
MSERKVDTETVRKQYTNDVSLIDEVEIIDVSAFDFDDTNVWLYIPPQCYIDTSIQNLYVWLKSESELILPGNRRFIDTRTFTRPKKRTSRMNFESISEAVSPPISNTWKISYPSLSHIGDDLNKQFTKPAASKVESVPPMLKVAPKANINYLPDDTLSTSGQESMEIFLNMSHSKGIDSFINLVEPGLNEPLMNVSQPSIFYSSITSLPRDDSLPSEDCDKEDVLANLTHTFSQRASIHVDVKNLHGNETFSMTDEPDNNKSHCLPTPNRTFNHVDNIEVNETYNAESVSSTVVLRSNKDKNSTINLSSTLVNKDDGLRSENDTKNESSTLNATYNTAAAEEAVQKLAERSQPCSPIKNTVPKVLENLAEPSLSAANSSYTIKQDIGLDATFKFLIPPGNQSTPKNMLNSTFQAKSKVPEKALVYNTAMNSTFKAPTSLRKELLAEIHRNADHKFDGTYNCVADDLHATKIEMGSCENVHDRNAGSNMLEENKYNTYKKEPSRLKAQVEMASDVGACVPNTQDKKYYTFTKKGNVHGGKTDMENAESLENADATFMKPLPKLQKRKQQQHIPRMLSKLPQFLQKSNPNLVSSSLKTISKIGCTNATSIGYMKGSQPNIVEKSVTNKLYALGKVKSGSEQRLLELNTGELQMMGAGGSTESIESTQSAHSAPDLDDRLSTCSDCSHNSYTVQPMNIEQLHQIVRMQEESLKQDAAPLLNRRVMDNTWTELAKNLPSPILKNGTDSCESDSSSLTNTDCNVKTSSPIISPTRFNQSVNANDHPIERVLKQQNETDIVKKAEVFNKPAAKSENKTRLRPPTNWSTGNRPANTLSAIPRPPSRIPGPRAVRPTVKTTQGDVKRGYM